MWNVRMGFLRSLGLGPANMAMTGLGGSGLAGGPPSLLDEKRVDMRFLVRPWVLDASFGFDGAASAAAVMDIQTFFHSVWPAMRMRTQPSMRPWWSVDG